MLLILAEDGTEPTLRDEVLIKRALRQKVLGAQSHADCYQARVSQRFGRRSSIWMPTYRASACFTAGKSSG